MHDSRLLPKHAGQAAQLLIAWVCAVGWLVGHKPVPPQKIVTAEPAGHAAVSLLCKRRR